jgi:hypothetical protein
VEGAGEAGRHWVSLHASAGPSAAGSTVAKTSTAFWVHFGKGEEDSEYDVPVKRESRLGTEPPLLLILQTTPAAHRVVPRCVALWEFKNGHRLNNEL